MLQRLHRLARTLRPLQPLALIATAACALGLALHIFGVGALAHAGAAIPLLLGLAFALALYTFIVWFRELPPPVSAAARWPVRLRQRCQRWLFALLAWLALALGLALLLLAYRLLKVWFASA